MSETGNVSFVDLCGRGDASPDQIDDFVELWHEGGSGQSLHDFLGMTWEEYSAWVLNPGLLPHIIASHREARAS